MKTNLIQTCLLAAALLALPAAVQAQFIYITNNGAITITGYTGSGGAVTIPATINSLPVTEIGTAAFDNTGLTRVTIPNSVTVIGGSAFFNCQSLTDVTIGKSVVDIREFAFAYSHLTNVIIPNSVTSIGNGAFYAEPYLISVSIGSRAYIGNSALVDGVSLQVIAVDTNNPAYSSVDGALFDKSQAILIKCPSGRSGNYVIPTSVTSLGDVAFYGCGKLTSITVEAQNPAYSSKNGVLFDKNQTTLIQYPIGNAATNYAIPNGVISIGDGAFFSCLSLISVTIPDSVTSIGDGAFSGCGSSSPPYLPHNGGLANVTMGNGVTNIGVGAFFDCYQLNRILIAANAPPCW